MELRLVGPADPSRCGRQIAASEAAGILRRDDLPLDGFALRIRRATASDADAVAMVYLRARHHAVPQIPPLDGSDDSVRGWLVGAVLRGDEVWVADTEHQAVVAMMLLEGGWIEQLYVDPDWIGRGIGSSLLDVAKRSRPDGLQLWTFQSNHGAHRFYERHGFKAEERTDGSGNQERTPDVRYVWTPTQETESRTERHRRSCCPAHPDPGSRPSADRAATGDG